MSYTEALDNVLTNSETYSNFNTLRYVAIAFFIINVSFYLIKTMASKSDELKPSYIYSRIALLIFLTFYTDIVAYIHYPLNAICGANNMIADVSTVDLALDVLFVGNAIQSGEEISSSFQQNPELDSDIAATIDAGNDNNNDWFSDDWYNIGDNIGTAIEEAIIDGVFTLGKICGAVVLSIRTAMLQILLGILPIVIVISLIFSFEASIMKWFELYVATLLMGAVVTLVELSIGSSTVYMMDNLSNGGVLIGLIQVLAYLILIFSSYQFSKSIVSASATWLTKHD